MIWHGLVFFRWCGLMEQGAAALRPYESAVAFHDADNGMRMIWRGLVFFVGMD
jgi:hypothetical protein